MDVHKNTMADIYAKFGLEPGTQDFIGHAMALHLDDSYLSEPALDTYQKILLYVGSVARYGKSPYIYPLYGLGELPQGFARQVIRTQRSCAIKLTKFSLGYRLSAIYGGTYMLDKPIDNIAYDESGKAIGVTSGGETAMAKIIICDPSYAKDKVRTTAQVVRAICLLKHPIPNTGDIDSVQIVIPQNQVQRKHDIYVACVSSAHNVCAKDYYLAIVSTIVETNDPMAEIQPGLNLLGPIHDMFVNVTPMEEPLADGVEDNVFISKSYDATSHFETVCDDVKDIYKRVTGKELVLKQRTTQEEEQREMAA
jgi:Rab GDP dissociation inhibitor